MTTMKKGILMLVLSLVYGLSQSIIEFGSDIGNMIASTLIPIIFTTIVSALYMGLKKVLKLKDFSFIEISWKIFIPLISILFFVLMLSFYNKQKTNTQSTNKEVYKKTVQDNNSKSEKEIGDVNTEFLNKDHLYENYAYNYTIKLPENYKVNYGIGKHSEILAYHVDSGYVMSANVKELTDKFTPSGLSHNEESERKVKVAFEEFKKPASMKAMEKAFEERSLADIKCVNYKLTNFNNRYFIAFKINANHIIDNEKYPVVIMTYMTFNKNYIYTFAFRTWSYLFNEYWEDKIRQAMSTAVINDNITNRK